MKSQTHSSFFKKFILIILISVSFYSCIGVRSAGSSGKISKYVEEFFVGNNVFQYFVKPLPYEGTYQKQAFVDATLRNKDKNIDSLTVNFTVSLRSSDYIEKVTIKKSDAEVVNITKVTSFFIEPSKEEGFYDHRASIRLPYLQYEKYLLTPQHSLQISNNSEKVSIEPSKKAQKSIEIIKNKFTTKIR